MIDPAQALAFSIQSGPGVYAVLLGSGVSRAAGIPTGWEITLDLVGKLRSSLGEVGTPSPEVWYEQKFGVAPEYSDLVEQFAKSREDRQQLLRSYVEPSEEEREEGKKIPTRAHRAIAALASRGFVRVVVTTNFDRLMETALAEEGVVPAVLASRDQIRGALPLVHSPCTVLKVHGDYLDTRIRNTEAELDEYPAELDQLLDRIFDEFGLVLCGWSAEWDGALRKALERCPSRRFTTYWAVRRRPSEAAAKLIEHRSAETIQTKGADEFFGSLQEQVEAVEEFSKPHPLSTEAAVANMKRYLPESRHRIRFADLVGQAVDDTFEQTHGDSFPIEGERPTDESIVARLERYDSACGTLVAMACVGGVWAEKEHCAAWRRGVQKLSSVSLQSGFVTWLSLARYPATSLLYALGVGAVHSDRLEFLGHLLRTPVQPRSAVARESDAGRELGAHFLREGTGFQDFAVNAHLREVLWRHFGDVFPDATSCTSAFERFEALLSLHCCYCKGHLPDSYVVVPPGSFVRRPDEHQRWLVGIRSSLSDGGAESPIVRSRLFGRTVEECLAALDLLEEQTASWGYFRFR